MLKQLFIIFLLIAVDCKRSRGGTYRYTSKSSGRTAYVGATNNFNRRRSEHSNKYPSSSYTYKENYMPKATSEQRYSQEKRDIKNYGPTDNKYAGGNGRRTGL